MNVEIGQVLSLKLRFNRSGVIAIEKHPYLIVKIIDNDTIEVAQFDKVRGKAWKLALESNMAVDCDNPKETVLDEDSFIQKDNTIQLEYFDDIINYRRQTDKLSAEKLKNVISEYNDYHNKHQIDEDKQIYITKSELIALNS